MSIDKMKIEVKSYLSESSKQSFYRDLTKIEQREYMKLLNAKYIIVQLFIQLGKSENNESPVFDFRNKDEIYVNIQPKIKSYMIFKSEDNFKKYINEEMDDKDLYLSFNVYKGKIVK